MKRHLRSGCAAAVLGCWMIWGGGETLGQPGAPEPPALPAAVEETAQPAPAAEAATPMTLDMCLSLGMQHQPAIDAAQASLNAALTGQRSLNRLIIPRLFARDLDIRKQQACQGVQIASAGLSQAEWETRYSITRNFFTVQFVRSQEKVVSEALADLTKGYDRANKLFKSGDPDVKITAVDLDGIKTQIGLVKAKKAQVDNGLLKAEAALREAMGVDYNFPLNVAKVDLPPAVYEVKSYKVKKDDKGKNVKEEVIEYRVLYPLESQREGLIASAIAGRPEMTQAQLFSVLTDLETAAQHRVRGWQGKTFAMGADIHAKPIPTGIFNNEYRPGAPGPEMPPMIIGRVHDRVQRAADFHQRALAVVDKTTNLVTLDVEAQYLKWREAAEEVRDLSDILDVASKLPDRVYNLNPKDYTSQALINANMTAAMVKSQLNDAKHMHALALAGLERATAGAFHIFPIPEAPLPTPKKQ